MGVLLFVFCMCVWLIVVCCRHVQINNEGAIDFYKKFGFEIVETKTHYYKRIEPADAHVLQKTLRKNDQTNGTHEETN